MCHLTEILRFILEEPGCHKENTLEDDSESVIFTLVCYDGMMVYFEVCEL